MSLFERARLQFVAPIAGKKAGLQPLKEGFWQFDTNLEPFENDHICGGPALVLHRRCGPRVG